MPLHAGKPGRRNLAWQLTLKQNGKTRTVYVSAELVPEVKLWVKEHKRPSTCGTSLSHSLQYLWHGTAGGTRGTLPWNGACARVKGEERRPGCAAECRPGAPQGRTHC